MNQKNNSQKEMKKDKNCTNKNKNISKYYKHKYI